MVFETASGESPALAAQGLRCTYVEPQVAALRGVTLGQQAGELVAVLGASGAGKTTLLKCLNRIIPCFQAAEVSGRLAVAGRWLNGETVGQLAGIVGMLFQDFEAQLFSTNVSQEVAFGAEQLGIAPDEVRRRVTEAIGAVGLESLTQRDPSTLSGGQKQRLAVASLLAMRPQAMLLDEPATDLDPVGRAEVYETLGRLRREGLTLLAVEHEVESVAGADQLLLMEAGRIVGAGPARSLIAEVDLFKRAGVRPFELAELAGRLGLPGCPLDAQEAAQAILAQGWQVSRARKEQRGQGWSRGKGKPVVKVEGATFAYEPGLSVLDDLSAEIGAGEFVAVVGRNGSGKTTLARHLVGLLRPGAGRILVDGTNLVDLPQHQIAGRVGYVFQNPDHQLFAPTVYEEVAFGPRNFGLSGGALRTRVEGALSAVGLDRQAERDPFLLSKGERQRLAVASVISLEPGIMILDEPTTGLDYREIIDLMRLIEGFHREGRTIVMITHTPWLIARYAERVLLMAGGRLEWEGPSREFFSRPDLLALAAFQAPLAAQVADRLGLNALTVADLVAGLERAGEE